MAKESVLREAIAKLKYNSGVLKEKRTKCSSTKEVAEMVGIGLKKAYRLLRTGEIRAFRCGNTFKAAKIEVIEYIYVRQCAQHNGNDPEQK